MRNSYERETRNRSPVGDRKCITISNVNTKRASERQIRSLFNRYGEILSIDLLNDYIVVKFSSEADARRARDRENGELLQSYRMQIEVGSGASGNGGPPLDNARDSRGGSQTMRRDQGGYRDDRSRQGGSGNVNQPPIASATSALSTQAQLSREELSILQQRPYDAAVIAMDQSLLNYAERIEVRLARAAALATHIVVLKEEAHVIPCVQDLTSKGVLYAVIINHVNEQHTSCILRVMYGTPQEHRNMPLEDALRFVVANFDAFLHQVKHMHSQEAPEDFSKMPPGFLPPTERVRYLLRLLADCRMLSQDELDCIKDFVIQRQERLADVEGGAAPSKRANLDAQMRQEEINKREQAADLQNKILSILAPPGGGAPGAVPGGPTSVNRPAMLSGGYSGNAGFNNAPPANSQNLNLNNPMVKEALNTLAPYFSGNQGGPGSAAANAPGRMGGGDRDNVSYYGSGAGTSGPGRYGNAGGAGGNFYNY